MKNRLQAELGISFTEFSYQLLQAYDFAVLHRDHGCRIQLGGSDQWGNIVAGIDLIKRQRAAALADQDKVEADRWAAEGKEQDKRKAKVIGDRAKEEKGSEIKKENEKEQEEEMDQATHEVYGLTTPLLTAENGDKFGKSAGNAVWLDENWTSVFDFYQVSGHHRSSALRQ